ncbi:MAG: 50S ribosomal protein L3 [Alphaproteobacteria bacterium]|nr:MAG: 50S ribosomal protein L3 [Alphaproteobacteria bacterium]
MLKGLMAKKLGMSQKFDENGRHIPVTLLKIDDHFVLEKKDNKLVLGVGETKETRVNKPQIGFLKKNKLPIVQTMKEFFCDDVSQYEIGQKIQADAFKDVAVIDVRAKTKGRGFSGVMKRHNFHGMRASHGVSISHRAHGSTGQCQDPGKVFKGKKMAGHYGDAYRTIRNLKIIEIDTENNVIVVGGAVPGPRNGSVMIKRAGV